MLSAVFGLDLLEDADEAGTLLWKHRHHLDDLSEDVCALRASLECLGSEPLSIRLVGNEPAEQQLTILAWQLTKLKEESDVVAQSQIPSCRLQARVDPELLEDGREMRAHFCPADPKSFADRAPVGSPDHQPEHIALDGSEMRCVRRTIHRPGKRWRAAPRDEASGRLERLRSIPQ
jgi:hypothetical protein